MAGYMYILECRDKSFYTGSTKYLERRIEEHNSGNGANYTEKRKPVKLLYYEEYFSVEDAFLREKQIQNWSRSKKIALKKGEINELNILAQCQNGTTSKRLYSWSHLRQN